MQSWKSLDIGDPSTTVVKRTTREPGGLEEHQIQLLRVARSGNCTQRERQ